MSNIKDRGIIIIKNKNEVTVTWVNRGSRKIIENQWREIMEVLEIKTMIAESKSVLWKWEGKAVNIFQKVKKNGKIENRIEKIEKIENRLSILRVEVLQEEVKASKERQFWK